METKQEKLRTLLKKTHVSNLEAPRNVSQEVYRRKLAADIARTKTYIQQAKTGIESLELQHGPFPEVYNETQFDNLSGGEKMGQDWTPETWRQAHLLAHYEVYKQMPYQPMKTDLIGIATALTLTLEAVIQQNDASNKIQHANNRRNDEIAELNSILADYKLAHSLIKDRIKKHPQRMAEMQQKIDKCTTYEAEVESKLARVQEISDRAKSKEEKLHLHLQRVILKVYAMMDWGNANFMDEDTFKKSIAGSVSLIKSLVSKLAENLPEKWVPVAAGTAEERLVEVMARNDLLLVRENNGLEVQLRSYGQR